MNVILQMNRLELKSQLYGLVPILNLQQIQKANDKVLSLNAKWSPIDNEFEDATFLAPNRRSSEGVTNACQPSPLASNSPYLVHNILWSIYVIYSTSAFRGSFDLGH